MSDFTLVPSGGPLAADVEGLDLAKPLPAETFGALRRAWNRHLVLRFRGQRLTDPQLIAFSRRFGTLDLAPVTVSGEREIPQFPEINVISNVVVGGRAIGSLGAFEAQWHTDMSYNDEPPMLSCLYALEVPQSGGNTGFLDMYRAYEALPDDLRAFVETHACRHDASINSAGQRRAGYAAVDDPREVPGAVHPLAPRHPETGRRALYLGRRLNASIPGLPLEESEAMLDRLWEHATDPRFRWEQVWRPGDLVFWDNRCTLHRRDAFDPASRRILHRTQVQGSRPYV